MELRQLEYFVTLAEERHFTRAARRTHIVQSGISSSIRALEQELGTSLFMRSTRRVELTEAGRAFWIEARGPLAAADAARQAVTAVEGLLRGTLALGIIRFVSTVDLLPIISRFHAAHPGLQMRVSQASSTALMDGVRK